MILLFALAACALDADSFPERYARLTCRRFHECDLYEFEYYYDRRRDCVDAYTATFQDWLGDCGLDVDAASACLDATRAASCDDWHGATGDLQICGEVMDCGDTGS